MQTPLGLFVLASGWFTQILLPFFVHCYSQWVAYVDFIGIICYSQWGLAQFHLVLLVLFVLSVGGLSVASGWYTQILLLFLFFPFSTARFEQRLA